MASSETSSTISSESDINAVSEVHSKCKARERNINMPGATLLDIYSGCGAMSTGLCLGAHLSGLNLVTVSLFFIVISLHHHNAVVLLVM